MEGGRTMCVRTVCVPVALCVSRENWQSLAGKLKCSHVVKLWRFLMSADCCLEIDVFLCKFGEVWLVLLTEQPGLQ